MDSHAPTRPSIWQKHKQLCPTSERKSCWFSKNKSSNVNSQGAAIPGFHNTNRAGKQPLLLRLSSTGDTVDDTSDFSSFEPANLRGSAKPKPGVFDRMANFAFSANSSDFQQSTARSFVRGMSENMANQVDLSILKEKFDNPQSKMERSGQNMGGSVPTMVHPKQGGGGMRGFVKEGIYHPFARHSPDQVAPAMHGQPVAAEMQQPAVHAFPIFNVSPFWTPYRRQHPHPYINKAHFVPDRRPNFTMASVQLWNGTPPPGIAPNSSDPHSHTPPTHVNRHHHGCQTTQIRDSAVLRNWIVDPRIRSQFINTESLAARLVQGHDATKLQSPQRAHHHASRNHMMKTRTEMTQQNQKPNKATGCVQTGSSHHVHRHPPCSQAKTLTQSFCSPKQSPRAQQASKCPSPNKTKYHANKKHKKNDQIAEEKHRVLTLDETDQPLESVTDEVKILKIQSEIELKAAIPESQFEHDLECDQVMPCEAHVTSSIDRVNRECATAVTVVQNPTGPKSENKETNGDQNGSAKDTGDNACSGKTHLLGSQDADTVDTEPIRESSIQESHDDPCPLENDSASKSTQSQSCENGESRLPLSSTPLLSPQEQVQSCALSPPEPATGNSPNPKPLHSSLAFILAETTSGDSDYSDSDWDSAGSSPPSDSWDFLKCLDDPYNPLYGWRCAKSQDQEKETESKLDDELDSGISSLQAQQDDTADVSPAESESWDEDESSLEESTLPAEPLCPSNDNVVPLSIVCSAVVNSPEATIQDQCATTDSTATCSLVQSEVPDNLTTSDPPESETKTSHSSVCEKSKSGNTQAPRLLVSEPQKLHPSVLFILGADSDSDCEEDEDDFEDGDEDSFDNIWSSSQQCPDPYGPLQGWRFCLTFPVNQCRDNPPAVDQKTATELSNSNSNSDNEDSTSAQKQHQFLAKVDPRPKLKRASTTGCLWIPCDGSGPGRPQHNKKVHFCEDSPLVINFESPSWSSEYIDSRRGPWQEMARDRCRFQDRIRTTEAQIGHIFTPGHRQKVQRRIQAQGV